MLGSNPKTLIHTIFIIPTGIIGVSLDLALNSRRLKDGEIFPRLNVSTGSGCIIEGILTILFVLAFLSTHEKENGRYQVTPSLVFGFGVAASFLIGVSLNFSVSAFNVLDYLSANIK